MEATGSVSGFETSLGTVKVVDGKVTREESLVYNAGAANSLNGENYEITDPSVKIAYTMYKPKAASATNPYPTVFVVPAR